MCEGPRVQSGIHGGVRECVGHASGSPQSWQPFWLMGLHFEGLVDALWV